MNTSTYVSSTYQLNQAKYFIKKCIFFVSPLCIIFIGNALIDPFNLNLLVSLPLEKTDIACHYNERLWKLNALSKNPQTHIILGDSRATRIDEKIVADITGKPFANLALSGATLVEIIDTFWFATQKTTLKEVIFCINFDRFNDWQKANGVSQAINTINNPLMSYLQPETCKASLMLVLQPLLQKKILHQKPPMCRDAFWHYQLDEVDAGYKRYVYPQYGQKQIQAVANYCHEHAIKLYFIILPTHIDLQQRIDKANLRPQANAFKELLKSLGYVYDLDTSSTLTTDANNFDDPKHLTVAATNRLLQTVMLNLKTENR